MLAVLYDIHANLPALEAVLADAESAGANRYVLGGDYAGLGAWPLETLARLHELEPAEWIRGNWERWMGSPSEAVDVPFVQSALAWVLEAVGDQDIEQLAGLPESLSREGSLYSHASPVSDMESFLPEPAQDEGKLIGGATEQRLVFGHTHLQFRRAGPGGLDLVNPGSVGLPFDGDTRAAYALVSDEGELELRRVEYDYDRVAARVRERMPGFGDDLAARIDTASPPA
jgi:diadenosine tetraphosphatase ApaH/serine/threonine PP2A family protein phosphatase